jgi:hypothetical protein
MPRAVAILTAGLALAVAAVLGAAGGGTVSGAPTTTVPATTTTVAGDPAATSTTVAAAAPSTTVVATTTVPRGGATAGSVAKPEPAEGWSIQRLVTLTALGIVALAAAGYIFGRFRSTPPIHPDL